MVTPNLIKGACYFVHCGGDEGWPWNTGQGRQRPRALSSPSPKDGVLPKILHLHVLGSECRLGHLVSILHQLIELAIHQDARVGIQPCKGQDTPCSVLPSASPPTPLREPEVEQQLLLGSAYSVPGTAKGLGSRKWRTFTQPHHTAQFQPRLWNKRWLEECIKELSPSRYAQSSGTGSCNFKGAQVSDEGTQHSRKQQQHEQTGNKQPRGKACQDGGPAQPMQQLQHLVLRCFAHPLTATSPCSASGTKHP